jgi:teichuronic acid exporter
VLQQRNMKEQVLASYSQQVVRSFLWQGGAQVAGQAVSWLATIVVIRFLAPADYGLMAMANVFLGFFFLFADLGFGAAAVQAPTLAREELRRMLGIVIVTHLGGCLLMVAGAPVVASFFDEPRLVPVIRALSLNFLLMAAYTLPQAQVLRDMDFRIKARIDVFSLIPAALLMLVLAVTGHGVWALVAGALTTHGLKAVLYNAVRPLMLMPALSWGTITRLAQFGAFITIDRVLYFLYGQADVVIGGRVLGKEALGLYTVALSLAVIPMEKVLPVITQVSFAAFSRIQADADRVRRNILRAIQLVSLACFPAFLGMAAIAGDLIPVVLGPRWTAAIVPFQLLSLVLPLKAIAALFPPALFGVGRPVINVRNMAFALAAMILAMLIGVRHGVVGMAWAWVIGYPVVFAVILLTSTRALGLRVADVSERCAFPAAASLIMGAVVLSIREALGRFEPSAWRLALLVASGALVYAALVFLFQRSAVRELITIIRR